MRARTVRTLAGTAVAALLLAGCSGSSGGGGNTQAGNTQAGGEVTIDYLAWVPKVDRAVSMWNAAHPQTQVKLIPTSGPDGTDPKIRAGVQSGNPSCLAQIAYYDLPSFAVDGSLMPVTKYAKQYESKFLPWTWKQVTFGETYGIPQDTGPVVMFYRKDLFAKYGIAPPTTWAEYAADAAKVHRADPTVTLGNFNGSSDELSAYASQANAHWFTTSGNSWNVNIDSDTTRGVADSWQQMVSSKVVSTTKVTDPSYYKQVAEGKILSIVGASWNSAVIAANVAGTSGKWAVAPVPKVSAGSSASMNIGGSAVAVLKGCKYPKQAVDFAAWLNTSEQSMSVLAAADGGGLFPAASQALNFPVVNAKVPFFGNQVIASVFAESAKGVDTSWQWGPTSANLTSDFTDGYAKVRNNTVSIDKMLASIQTKTVADIKAKGISVTGG